MRLLLLWQDFESLPVSITGLYFLPYFVCKMFQPSPFNSAGGRPRARCRHSVVKKKANRKEKKRSHCQPRREFVELNFPIVARVRDGRLDATSAVALRPHFGSVSDLIDLS